MIKPNWDTFSSKFSTNKESTFEWFAYLLFCREFDLPKGWFGYKNQSSIERIQLHIMVRLLDSKPNFTRGHFQIIKDFIEMLEKSKRDYEDISKILIYTNQLWGQGQIEVDGSKNDNT